MTTLTFTSVVAAMAATELVLASVATTKLVFAAVSATELVFASVVTSMAATKLVFAAVTATMAALELILAAVATTMATIAMIMVMKVTNLLKLILELFLGFLLVVSLLLSFLLLGSRLLLGLLLLFLFLGRSLLLLFLLGGGGLLFLLGRFGRLSLLLTRVDLISLLDGMALCLLEGWILGWLSVHELGVLSLINDAIHGALELLALALGKLMDGFLDLLGDRLSDLFTRLVDSEDGLVDEVVDGFVHIMSWHILLLLFSNLLLRLFLLLLFLVGLRFLLLDNLLLLSVLLLLNLLFGLLVFSLLLFASSFLFLLDGFSFDFNLFFGLFDLLLTILDLRIDFFGIFSASRLISFSLSGGVRLELLSDLTFDFLELFLELFFNSFVQSMSLRLGIAIAIELKEVHGLVAVIDSLAMLHLEVFHVDGGRLHGEDASKKC